MSVEGLKGNWNPNDQSLDVCVNISNVSDINVFNETKALSPSIQIGWTISWFAKDSSLTGSGSVIQLSKDLTLQLSIPKGTVSRYLRLEAAAVVLYTDAEAIDHYPIPSGASLTEIDPVEIFISETNFFPVYTEFGDGKRLLQWSVPSNVSELLDEDVYDILGVVLDLNNSMAPDIYAENNREMTAAGDQYEKHLKLTYTTLIADYLRIIIKDPSIFPQLSNGEFVSGTFGDSAKRILQIVLQERKLRDFDDLSSTYLERPYEIMEDATLIFSRHL